MSENIIKPGQYKVIRVDGTETMHEEKVTLGKIYNAIGSESIDTVILDPTNEQIMCVDDTGMLDCRPINEKATALYRAVCRPGTLGNIHGDVVIVNDADFA